MKGGAYERNPKTGKLKVVERTRDEVAEGKAPAAASAKDQVKEKSHDS